MKAKLLKVDPAVRVMIFDSYHGYCCVKDYIARATELMHGLPKTDVNIRKYPLFIHSVFNCFPGCHHHHETIGGHAFKPANEKVAEMFEGYLQGIAMNPVKYLKMIERVERK